MKVFLSTTEVGMSIVPTIRLDVNEDANINLEHLLDDDTRVIVTDKRTGSGFVGSFMTGGLTLMKVIQNIQFLEGAAFRHRKTLGLV